MKNTPAQGPQPGTPRFVHGDSGVRFVKPSEFHAARIAAGNTIKGRSDAAQKRDDARKR